MEREMKTSGWPLLAITILLSAPLLVGGKARAADNLSFTGNLVVEACTIRPGDEALELELRDVSSRDLYLNIRTPGRLFEIHLEGCDTSISDSVITTFSGVENSELPGFLALAAGSTAKGVAIGLETLTDNLLPLNVASDPQTLSDGANAIGFKAYIRGEPKAIEQQTIIAGQYSAVSTFTLAYP